MVDLPLYRIQESGRTQTIRMRASLKENLVVVVIPKGLSPRRIRLIIEQNRETLEQLHGWMEDRRRVLLECRQALPETIRLESLDQVWAVAYERTERPGVLVTPGGEARHLVVTGAITNEASCRAALRRWLIRMAELQLIPWLRRVAETRGFRYERTRVALQHTRWGSCSGKGTISLNARLLLLPADLVEGILIHELCHTTHLNHRAAFWQLVAIHDPDYQDKQRRLKVLTAGLPGWSFPEQD